MFPFLPSTGIFSTDVSPQPFRPYHTMASQSMDISRQSQAILHPWTTDPWTFRRSLSVRASSLATGLLGRPSLWSLKPSKSMDFRSMDVLSLSPMPFPIMDHSSIKVSPQPQALPDHQSPVHGRFSLATQAVPHHGFLVHGRFAPASQAGLTVPASVSGRVRSLATSSRGWPARTMRTRFNYA